MRLAVLASGSGTILQAMFEAGLPVAVVLSDRPCAALDIAAAHQVPAELVDRKSYGGYGADFDREAFSAAVAAVLVAHQVDLIAMAGFGTVLAEPLHKAFPGRVLNTHPALLPAFPGWHAVRDAIAAGVRETGCTVHLATLEMDAGPILAQEPVKVTFGDTEETLHERIKVVERKLYPATVAWALGELEAGREIESPRAASRAGHGQAENTGGNSAPPGQPPAPSSATPTGSAPANAANAASGAATTTIERLRKRADQKWRRATVALRPYPDIMIIGAQRGGTTSLRNWLGAHPTERVFQVGEVHYFDNYYDHGEHWYRERFPTTLRRQRRVESSPYMLFHPLAPARAAKDLPTETRFVVLLREPADRALSHYRRIRALGRERQTFAEALASEDDRLAGELEKVLAGEVRRPYQWFSYRTRGLYAEQVERWYAAVGTERIKVVESERLYVDRSVGRDLLAWLDLPVETDPFPSLNASPPPTAEDQQALEDLLGFYEPHNERLFALLGRRLWER